MNLRVTVAGKVKGCLLYTSTVEVGGIRGVAVKCLDITKNSDREGIVPGHKMCIRDSIKRESSTRAWMVFGEDVVLLRGHSRVKKKRTVMIPVYAGHIRGCEKKREKRVSSGSPETEQMPFPYG